MIISPYKAFTNPENPLPELSRVTIEEKVGSILMKTMIGIEAGVQTIFLLVLLQLSSRANSYQACSHKSKKVAIIRKKAEDKSDACLALVSYPTR